MGLLAFAFYNEELVRNFVARYLNTLPTPRDFLGGPDPFMSFMAQYPGRVGPEYTSKHRVLNFTLLLLVHRGS